MAPGVDSPAWRYTQAIVGAEDVQAGNRGRASGVVARGNTLTVRFTREVRDFAAWTTMPFFCAVPPTLPPSAEGVRAFPGAGPYIIREYRPNERIVIRTQPLLRRRPRPPRRRLRRRPQRQLTAGSPRPNRSRQSRLGLRAVRTLLRAATRPHPQVRHRLPPIPGQSRPDRLDVRLQLVAAALQGQPAAAPCREPRAQPDGVRDPKSVPRRRPTSYVPPLVPGFRDHRIYPLEGDMDARRRSRRASARPARPSSTCPTRP